VDPGETTLYPEAVYDPLAELPEDQLYVVLRGNPWECPTCGAVLHTRIIATPLLNPTTVTRKQVDGTGGTTLTDRRQTVTGGGTTFSFVETFVPPPARKLQPGLAAIQVSATGDAGFFDVNGDGVYDILRIGGSNRGTPVPQTDIGLVFRDVNGDGKADYVSIPWALSGLLGVKQTNSTLGGAGPDPQIWLPLNDKGGNHLPTTVDVRFPDPRTPGAFGGLDGTIPIVPSGLQGVLSAVPGLSTAGLAALSLALAAGGVLLLRSHAAASA
jgi:hypothetical protein